MQSAESPKISVNLWADHHLAVPAVQAPITQSQLGRLGEMHASRSDLENLIGLRCFLRQPEHLPPRAAASRSTRAAHIVQSQHAMPIRRCFALVQGLNPLAKRARVNDAAG